MNLKNNTKGGEKMLNQVIFVGRLTKDIELQESENGNKYAVVTLAIPRTFKNAEGVYETDFVDCVLWTGIAENTTEYCKKGDVLGVKGRVQTRTYENAEKEKRYVTEVVAEKVTFLSSRRGE